MWADPDADYDKIGALQAELEDKIAAADAWSLERNVEIAMDALRCPPDDADVTTLSRRRAAPRRPVPAAAQPPRPAAARRADQPPRRRERASGWSASCRTTAAPSWRSPTTATSSTTSPSGSSSSTAAAASRSRATTRRGWSRSRSAWPARRSRTRPASARWQRELEWVRMAPKARQAKGKARLAAYDKLQAEAEAAERGADALEITIPAGKRLGDTVIEVDGLRKGFGDRLLIEDLSFSLPQGRHRRDHRSERRRQDDAVQDAHRPGARRRRHDHDRRHGAAGLRRPVARRRSTRTRPCSRRSPTASST